MCKPNCQHACQSCPNKDQNNTGAAAQGSSNPTSTLVPINLAEPINPDVPKPIDHATATLDEQLANAQAHQRAALEGVRQTQRALALAISRLLEADLSTPEAHLIDRAYWQGILRNRYDTLDHWLASHHFWAEQVQFLQVQIERKAQAH